MLCIFSTLWRPFHASSRQAGAISRSFASGVVLACVLTACGGGGGGSASTETGGTTSGSSATGTTGSSGAAGSSDTTSGTLSSAAVTPSTDAEAYRFLTQATFGPTPADVAKVKSVGYGKWIDDQFDLHLQSRHLDTVVVSASALHMDAPHSNDIVYTWWTHAVEDPAQLRQRVAFALSEIFVVSTLTQDNGRTIASYMDMLTDKADANYRDLLEAVALHPAMGQYLSHLGNLKEDKTTGRVPDENFAREVMQLFSVGLYMLEDTGKPKLVDGNPVETYTADDIKGMAKVFTGFSWHQLADKTGLEWWFCFFRTSSCNGSSQDIDGMSPYKEAHASEAKSFLGITIPAQSQADPRASIKAALDRLATHPNTAPFISRQLIQRLVTSNPSDTYVSDITKVFRASNGNLRTVVKAILLHDEARQPNVTLMPSYGKLKEPVLRLTHLLRALPHNSVTYDKQRNAGQLPFLMAAETGDIGTSLGQTPFRSPSVFNFFRPGYRPPQTQLPADMVSPESQITSESSVLSYANFVSNILETGWGQWKFQEARMDIQFDLSQWNTLNTNPAGLVDAVSRHLLGKTMEDAIRTEAINAITAMPSGTDRDRRQRIQAAVLLVAVSPDFIVQQ